MPVRGGNIYVSNIYPISEEEGEGRREAKGAGGGLPSAAAQVRSRPAAAGAPRRPRCRSAPLSQRARVPTAWALALCALLGAGLP